MKTSLLIEIEHPDDLLAYGLIEHTIKPVLDDINADSEKDWSVTVVSDTRDRALRSAIESALSEFPEEWSNEDILDGIHDDHELVVVWEPFENWDKDSVIYHIEKLAQTIYSTYF